MYQFYSLGGTSVLIQKIAKKRQEVKLKIIDYVHMF